MKIKSEDSKRNLGVSIILTILIGLILQRCIIYATQDFQMDYFGFYEAFRMFINGTSPYYNTPDSYTRLWSDGIMTGFRYPPTVLVILSWLGLVKYGLSKIIWMTFLASAIIGQILLIRKYLGEYASIFIAMLMLSYPLEFSLQRGGIDILLAFCITCFVILYLRKERKWLATTLLALVISIKITPMIFALIYLKDKDYRGFIRLIALVALISGLSFGIASVIYPDTIPDFLNSVINFDGINNTYGLHSIRDNVVDNWVVVDGWKLRFSMNYFGSYVSISLIRFINVLTHFFGFKINILLFTMAGLFGVWLLSIKSSTKTLIVRLLLVYPVLNPLAWGPSIVIMFIGLTYIFEDIRLVVTKFKGDAGKIDYLKLGLFVCLAFIVLSPRYMSWQYHGLSEALKCASVCILVFMAGMFERGDEYNSMPIIERAAL